MFNNLIRRYFIDGTTLNPGALGDTIATKDIGGIKHELVIIEFDDGAGGATRVSAANPLPVLASIDTTGLATAANQATEIAALASIAAEDFATQTTLAAVLAKISSDPATQTTLAAILAKIIAAPSTEAKQDIIITALGTLLTISDFDTKTGSLTETAPATDTASSGLNGRLQRIAQRITSMIALLPAALGAGGGLKIDGSGTAVPISGTVAVTGAGDASAANQTSQITQETAINTVLGLISDAIVAAGATGSVSAKLRRVTQGLEDLKSLIVLAAGSAIIGKVGIDQTTPGTTNLVALSAETTKVIGTVNNAAGSNIIGKVGIDQTTPGTTNLVALAANQSVNINQIAGTGTAVNSGNKDNGTQRVVLATDQPALTNPQPVKGTLKPSYGSTVVMTVTNLQSLATSATAGWQSVRVSNLSTLATDYEIMVKLTTANTAPGSDKAMYVFICPFYTSDGGTTWFASSQGTATLPTGTEGTTTIASPHNLRLLGVLNYTTQQMVVQDTFLLSNCFGNRMPDAFSIIIINFSGANLSTGCVVDYSPLNDAIV